MNTYKNKGMYLETVINKSIYHYEAHNLAIFRKQNVPIKIKEVNDQEVKGYLYQKCDVDYYGVYQGQFIAIEAKQTIKDYFNYHYLMPHQIEYLDKVEFHGGRSLIIIYRVNQHEFYVVDWNVIKQSPTRKIKFSNLKPYLVDFYFPGRIDFLVRCK